MVYTPMVRVRGMSDGMRQARKNQSLLGTEGTAWDVGYAAVYLASHEAKWVTGVCLPVDAGTTAGNRTPENTNKGLRREEAFSLPTGPESTGNNLPK